MDTTLTAAELCRTLEEFRTLNPIVTVAAVLVFLAVAEGGGEMGLKEVAEATGMPFTQVCRHADNLSKGDSRKVPGGMRVARLVPGTGPVPRLGLTEAGWALHARMFRSGPRPVAAAA